MRYCIGCIHLMFDPGEKAGPLSDMTWDDGWPIEFSCQKGHWRQEVYQSRRDNDKATFNLQKAMAAAESCPNFSERTL